MIDQKSGFSAELRFLKAQRRWLH